MAKNLQQKEEMEDARETKRCCDPEQKKEEKTENGRSEKEAIVGEGSGRAIVAAERNIENPPEDDCCPICFDAFTIPCRTICGHWFCSSCILQYWHFKPQFKRFTCPVCGQLVSELIPESSLLIQQEEETGKLIQDIQLFNRLHIGGWCGFFQKTFALRFLIRRRYRAFMNRDIYYRIDKCASLIGMLLGFLYEACDFHFFPYGGVGILIMCSYCGVALSIILLLDARWDLWGHGQRGRNFVQLQPDANLH